MELKVIVKTKFEPTFDYSIVEVCYIKNEYNGGYYLHYKNDDGPIRYNIGQNWYNDDKNYSEIINLIIKDKSLAVLYLKHDWLLIQFLCHEKLNGNEIFLEKVD